MGNFWKYRKRDNFFSSEKPKIIRQWDKNRTKRKKKYAAALIGISKESALKFNSFTISYSDEFIMGKLYEENPDCIVRMCTGRKINSYF